MKNTILLLAAIGLLGCKSDPVKRGNEAITYAQIEKHIAILSADENLGRMPMTFTEPAVTGYIAGEMKSIGLEPAHNGSFFQEVPVLKVTSSISPMLSLTTPAGKLDIPKMDGYVSFTRKMKETLTLDNSEVIFAGFGITAPEFKRNDFRGVDVRGKTILVFVNDPGFGSEGDYFRGNTMTYYGRWTYKFEEAARQGAKACFIIHETGPAGYGWNVVSNNGETTKLYLEPEDGYRDRCDFEGWISHDMAREIFSRCGMDLDSVRKLAVSPDFRPFSLPLTASAWIKNRFETGTSRNVCGMIRGKVRPEEVIVYTAHWDHLGTGSVVNGDSIYNGATDNASAVAWMLEIARAFKSGPAPQRSLLFLSVTGEESGLLGSEYYTGHPFFAMNKTVACINTDVLLFLGEFNDVTLTGSAYSELDKWVVKRARVQHRYLADDPNPENGMFFRSDHFPFVKKGVPAIFAKGYSDARKLGPEKTKELIAEYWRSVYHTPRDEYHPGRDDLGGVVQDARLMYMVGFDLANSDDWPAWNSSSEFSRREEGEKK